jgi:hypothetical protein
MKESYYIDEEVKKQLLYEDAFIKGKKYFYYVKIDDFHTMPELTKSGVKRYWEIYNLLKNN